MASLTPDIELVNLTTGNGQLIKLPVYATCIYSMMKTITSYFSISYSVSRGMFADMHPCLHRCQSCHVRHLTGLIQF